MPARLTTARAFAFSGLLLVVLLRLVLLVACLIGRALFSFVLALVLIGTSGGLLILVLAVLVLIGRGGRSGRGILRRIAVDHDRARGRIPSAGNRLRILVLQLERDR